MAPARWIHCNLCFHMMAKMERKFYHLSCRHVLCRSCMAKTNRGTMCPVCREPLGRFTELNNQMDRKDKMCYDPSALRAWSIIGQSVLFQHKQRENVIRCILRCRSSIPQLKEMENTLRQRIVATQRQYEKFRNYRRNLQDILRQSSPGYGAAQAIRPAVPAPSPLALSNRGSDRGSRFQVVSPFTALSSPMITPTNFSGVASARAVAMDHYPQGSSTSRRGKPAGGELANDSGISDMRTPASTVSSRVGRGYHHQPSTPAAPAATALRRPHPFHYNPVSSKIPRR